MMFREVQRVVNTNASPDVLWKRILDVAGESKNAELRSLDFEASSRVAAQQLSAMIRSQPLPSNLSFVYVGLVDLVDRTSRFNEVHVGCYFAGGTSFTAEESLNSGDLSYFPQNRFFKLEILDRIKRLNYGEHHRQQLFDYVILFGAAAILAKEAVASVGIRAPLYVGFDSGDYALISIN